MPRFIVQAVPQHGYAGSYRAGRFWPSNAGTTVELVDQEEDPAADPGDEVPKIGQASFRRLQEDSAKITIRPDGDPMALARSSEDIAVLRREVERLAAENEQLRAQLGTATTQQSHAVGEESGGRRGKRHTEGG